MTSNNQTNASKYKIRIRSTSPEMSEEVLFAKRRCVLGISMSNPIFWRSSMNDLLQWMHQNFEERMLVVGDYLHRHNEANIQGTTPEEAIKNALRKGDNFMEHLNQFLSAYPENAFNVVRWEKFLHTPTFAEKLKMMQDIYRNVEGVRSSIERTIALFMQRRSEQDLVQLVDESLITQYSLKYLLEEMAVFSNLIEDDWPVILYPGEQLPVLVEFARGDYAHVPEQLSSAVYVELNVIKKR